MRRSSSIPDLRNGSSYARVRGTGRRRTSQSTAWKETIKMKGKSIRILIRPLFTLALPMAVVVVWALFGGSGGAQVAASPSDQPLANTPPQVVPQATPG